MLTSHRSKLFRKCQCSPVSSLAPHRRTTIVRSHLEKSELNRRETLAGFLLLSSLYQKSAHADEETSTTIATETAPPAPPVNSYESKVSQLYDPILAYRFNYPIETVSGKKLRMVISHEPEKYSSAAPLTADARQRIVSEIFDFTNFVTVSMTVGPAAGLLREIGQDEWRARDVASTVLIDRSTARVTNGQRVALNDVEEAHIEDRPWGRVYCFEHLSQGSPTEQAKSRETYRHALAVTGSRLGGDGQIYLYTLNFSCREEMWADLSPVFAKCIESFKLEPTTDQFISPDQNPWLFF